ncbi:MAG: response regulator transcription factor [Oscillospiraceae bacterium]|jgi:two-component system alkaline phosphatase synthesis response regulator PhoP|nr:response regulator transcription factor [Oscillospiraceae bacterium]
MRNVSTGSVFIVEDDASIREMVEYALETAGFTARGFSDGEAFLAAIKASAPVLVLLDIMLPGDDGLTLLRRLKSAARTRDVPVIMLTAKGSELDRVKGLDFGADDYIAKPFSVMELISRIRAVLRRYTAAAPAAITIGDVTISTDSRNVTVCDQVIPLTFKEFELLHCLMLNEGIVMTRDRLLDLIWGFDFGGETRTVDMHVKSLRSKLKSGGAILKTVRNVGYKAEPPA